MYQIALDKIKNSWHPIRFNVIHVSQPKKLRLESRDLKFLYPN